MLGAELLGAQAELPCLRLHCYGVHERVDTLIAEQETTATREITATRNLQAAEVARNRLSREVSTAMRRANWMFMARIDLRTEFDDCLGASNLS